MGTARPKKILLHICCVACASHVVPVLEKDGFEVVCLFEHPEIDSKEEHHLRLVSVRDYCRENNLRLIEREYKKSEFVQLVAPYKDPDSLKFINDKDRYRRRRCYICNSLSVQKMVEMAKKEKIKFFSTTLLCSPYKDFDQIVEIANEKALDYGLNFYFQDFRKGYWMGRNYARNHFVYTPRYCGCSDSVKEKRFE